MQVVKELLPQPHLITIIENDLEYIKKEKEKLWREFRKKNAALIKKQISGFRPDSVPRSFGEKKFELGEIYKDLLNEILSKGLTESGLSIVAINSNRVEIGTNDGPIVLTIEVDLTPQVELGQYEGLSIKHNSVDVTEGEINAVLQRMRESKATEEQVTGRAIQDKDIVSIEFIGTIDGIEFEGGSTKKPDGTHNPWSLRIGSGQFIRGFEEQLIGANIGDNKKVTVTFPENYHKQEFRSKEAVFDVTIKGIMIKKLPELNDNFAKEVGYENLIDARNNLKEDLASNKQQQREAVIESQILSELDKNCKVSPIPRKILQEQLDLEFRKVLLNVKMDEKTYFEKTRSSRDDFDRQYKPIIEKDFRIRYILETIAIKENITASDIELRQELENQAKKRNVPIEQLNKEYIEKNLVVRKTLDFIKENTYVEKLEEPKVTEMTLEEKDA